MLNRVKLALRISTDAFDSEINDLIESAKEDLALAGVVIEDEDGPLIVRAVITYCKANFGQNEEALRLKASYDEQKAQLRTATGYTDWRE